MMAGTSKLGSKHARSGVSADIGCLETADFESMQRLDSRVYLQMDDLSEPMCVCPVCTGSELHTLSALGSTRVPGPEEDELVPNIAIGATGIVLPDPGQLARWFRVPIPPKFKKSRLHAKALQEGKQHGIFTFFSTFSFVTVFFTPNRFSIGLSLLASVGTGLRSWFSIKRLAYEEDRGIALELTVRKHAYKARIAAWERLYYCNGCGLVHDRVGRRSLPWYSMLQLVHYPEQEFQLVEPTLVFDVHQASNSETLSSQDAA